MLMIDCWNNIKSLFTKLKDLITLGSANVIGNLISGVFWLYIASLVGTEEYGEISYFWAIAGIAYIVAMFGTGNAIIIYTAKEGKTQSSLYFIATVSGIVTSIIIFLIFYKIEVSLFVIGGVIFGIASTELYGRKLYKKYSKYFLSQKILAVGMALGLYYLIGLDGIILGYALSFFPYFKILYKGLKGAKIDLLVIKSKFGFMMNSNGLEISKRLSFSLDKLIILPLFGASLLGNYQLGFQFITILSLLSYTVYDYLLPQEASGKDRKKIKIATILSSIVLAILGITLAPLILSLLFPKFEYAIEIVRIMSIAIIPMSFSLMYTSKFLGMEKSKIVFISAIIYLTVQVTGIFILGDYYGIGGIAVAFVLAHTAQAVFLASINRKMP